MRLTTLVVFILTASIALTGCGDDTVVKDAKNTTGKGDSVACHNKFEIHNGYNVCAFQYKGMECLFTNGHGGGIWCDNSERTAALVAKQLNGEGQTADTDTPDPLREAVEKALAEDDAARAAK